MKKSKIIVPALGLLLLSTAASVSGTVAWFTANRVYSNTISSFSVGELDGALQVSDVANIVGTTVTDTTSVSTQLAVGGHADILTDASWDYTTGTLYTDNGSATNTATGFNESSFVSLGTAAGPAESANDPAKWKCSTTVDNYYYYAAAYSITFQYDFGGNDANVNLFVDLSDGGSSFAAAKVGENAGTEIKSGLRIGLAGESTKVLAPFQGTASNVKYASSTTGVTTTPASVLSTSSTGTFALAKATDVTTSQSSRLDYLGTFEKATNTITVKVVIWLEGTDPNVTTANIKDTFSGTLKFYCATNA